MLAETALLERVRREARELGINVWVCLTTEDERDGCINEIDGATWILLTAIPDTRPAYLVAMHELGHAADPEQWRGLRLDRETRAWQWAVSRIPDLTENDRRYIVDRLYTYAANKRCRRTMTFEDFILELTGL